MTEASRRLHHCKHRGRWTAEQAHLPRTVHLLVGIAHASRPVEHLASESKLLELGREVEEHRRIRDKKLRKLRKTLRHQLRVARKLGAKAVLIAATEAIRRAPNGRASIKALEAELKVPIHVLPGRTEARLAFLGTSSLLDVRAPQMLIDSGGGSTEVTLTEMRVGHHGLRDGMIMAWQRVEGNWWRYRRR